MGGEVGGEPDVESTQIRLGWIDYRMHDGHRVLDHDQRVDAPQQHGVHVDEVDGDDAAGLRGQGPLPGRARAAGRRGRSRPRGRICQTVETAIRWPSLTNSPCTRRCPRAGFPVAMRITSLRTAAAVDGRPGPRRLV